MSKEQADFFFADESQTLAFGQQLAAICPTKLIIFLQGELGAGKTTLVRGFLQGLGHQGLVKSPTYTLVESYELTNKTIYHFDLYRLTNPEELDYIGIRDYLSQTAILLIEWPERGAKQLPSADLTCYIEAIDSGRRLQLSAYSEQGQKLLAILKAHENK